MDPHPGPRCGPRARDRHRERDFRIGKRDDATGTTTVWGRINSLDAAIAAQRVRAMVSGVCADDPRTLAQKRADAVGAVFAGVFELACLCATADCPAADRTDARATSVVVHVVADAAALDTAPEPGPPPTRRAQTRPGGPANTQPEPELAPEPGPARPAAHPALIPALRGAVLPAPLLAEVIARGAKIRFVTAARSLPANPGYRPLTALDEFVRARDLTCRHPGCDRPAIDADLDHTIAWPVGPTHPANIKAYCRLHHLLKTFWEGWHEHQSPDGAVRITTPTGHSYTTKPFSALLFPSWNTTLTGPPPEPAPNAPSAPSGPGREVMMPRRRRTREQSRAAYRTRAREHNAIQRELDRAAAEKAAEQRRAQRQAQCAASPKRAQWAARQDAVDRLLASLDRPPGYQPDYGNDPPPF